MLRLLRCALFLGFAAAASAPLTGCAGARPVADDDLRLQAAAHAFGGRFDYLIVESSGAAADAAFVQYARTFGPSELSHALAGRLAPAANAAVRMMVTGRDGAKTLQVLTDALSLLQGRRLAELELLFLGDPAYDDGARAAVEAAGGRYHFAPFAD